MAVRATVGNGRLTVDRVIDDVRDQLDDREREALAAAISRSLKESEDGRSAPARDIIQKLRERRLG